MRNSSIKSQKVTFPGTARKLHGSFHLSEFPVLQTVRNDDQLILALELTRTCLYFSGVRDREHVRKHSRKL